MKSPSYSFLVATLMLGVLPFTHAQVSTKHTEPAPDGPSTNRTGATNSASSQYRQVESGKGPSGSATRSASNSRQQGSSGPPSQSAASKAPEGSVGHESKSSADKSDAKQPKSTPDKSNASKDKDKAKDKAQGGAPAPKAGTRHAPSASGTGSGSSADPNAPKKP